MPLLRWLDTVPDIPTGVTVGVPWPQGSLQRGEAVTLRTAEGKTLPVQQWPLGFWHDGSVKWTALAAVLDGHTGKSLVFEKGKSQAPSNPIRLEESKASICVKTGALRYEIRKKGQNVFQNIAIAGTSLCSGAKLVCQRERRTSRGKQTTRERCEFTGLVKKAAIEQKGSVRAVVKLEGVYKNSTNSDSFLPFILRLYFYQGLSSVRIVHTFIYDGDAERDFIAGLGFRFKVPLRDEPHNRRIWFAGDEGGVWMESVRGVPPRLPLLQKLEVMRFLQGISVNPERIRHIRGEYLASPGGIEAMPVWNNFTLIQDSADHFVIRKGCGPDFARIDAYHGKRSPGTVAISDSRGGLAISIRDFWQSYPSGLSIEDAGHKRKHAVLIAWLWPPESDPIDLRHYTDKMHGPMYECFRCMEWEAGPYDPKRSNPYGIARTSELMLWCLPGSVTRQDIARRSQVSSKTPMLVCKPEYYHKTKVFGVWSLPRNKSEQTRTLEHRLNELLDFYVREVDHRSWYGFWNYGDVMHSYDPDRHKWRYDEGGYAWDNTECSTDIWLWHSFLRTGRADVFRLAEAMTRHTSEVDIYHLGPLAGLGSRHNVIHWGCLCKEPRISMAGCRRFYYFLTGDERTGDILTEVCDSWPKTKVKLTVAPHWGSFCWNWVTAWERTGDTCFRDKILRGIKGILARKPPLIAGPLFTFDPETSEMSFIENQEPYSYHMTLPFGAPEIWMEIAQLLDHPEWADALAGYGQFWAMDPEERDKLVSRGNAVLYGPDGPLFSARMVAYAARRGRDFQLAHRAWKILLDNIFFLQEQKNPDTGKNVKELLLRNDKVGTTNIAAQWSLNVIECLAMIEPFLTDDLAP